LVLPSVGQIIIALLTNAQFETCQGTPEVSGNSTVCNDPDTVLYLAYYSTAMVLALLFSVFGGVCLAFVRFNSAKNIFSSLLSAISHCSVDFFDQTPLGRISNRFAKDQATIDTMLSQFFMWILLTVCMVLAAVVSVSVGTDGVYLAVLVPVMWVSLMMLYKHLNH
jgi:ABC-type multidrug transport system fused ATPase/permease subunit